MSYKSQINLGLSRIPPTKDDKIYAMMQEVYNALHLLNSKAEATVDVLQAPTAASAPSDSFGPRLNTFWADAVAEATRGRIVSLSGTEFGVGVAGLTFTTTAGDKRVTDPYGIVVAEPEGGQSLIAWPPFVLLVDLSASAAPIGGTIYTDSAGAIVYAATDPGSAHWPVGRVIATDMVLFISNMHS